MSHAFTALRPRRVTGRHPFRCLSERQRLGFAAVLGTVALALHRRQSIRATTPAAPHGMLSFALTGSPTKAARIRTSWSRSTQAAADGNLRLDALFSLTWTNAIALADLWAADQLASRRWPAAGIGDAMAWAQWGAALLSAAKDGEKLAALRGRSERPLDRGARWATLTEIATKSVGIAYAAATGIPWLIDRRHRRRRP